MKIYFLLFLLLIGGLLSNNNDVSALPMQKRQVPKAPPKVPQEPAAKKAPPPPPPPPPPPVAAKTPPAPAPGNVNGGTWQIVGTTGVNAMHMFVLSSEKVIIVDKAESNPLKQASGQPAVSVEYNLKTNQVTPLNVVSDTFCSAGSWLGNGTMLHTGGDNGNPQLTPGGQSLRFYDPAVGNWVERTGLMPSKRWYPSMLPLANGKVLLLGGSTGGTGLNRAEINNPTYTIWPPSNGGDAPDPDTPFQFLVDTLPYNLYVFLHLVPNTQNKNILFILSNTQGILYDLDTKTTLVTYPKISSQRTYPQTGTSLMLPLFPETNYKAEIMVCGGQAVYEVTATADSTCGRLDLTAKAPTWVMDNFGGIPRVMPDNVILPDGQVLFLNGAQTGYAGFRKGPAANPLWVNSNPAFNPVLYDPIAKKYTKMNPSTVARMYHSVASLLPDGSIFVAGSNPQGSVARGVLFPTEYRAEIFKPPNILTNAPRPTILSIDGVTINQSRIPVKYGQTVNILVKLTTTTTPTFTASLIHLGFVTHSQHMGQKFVGLNIIAKFAANAVDQYVISATLPPNPTITAPGPHFIYILADGVPCELAADVLLTNN